MDSNICVKLGDGVNKNGETYYYLELFVKVDKKEYPFGDRVFITPTDLSILRLTGVLTDEA